MHPCIHPSMQTFIHTCIHANIHTSIHPYIHPSTHTYISRSPFPHGFRSNGTKYMLYISRWHEFLTYMYLYIYIYIFIYLHIGKKLQAFLAKVLVAMCGHFYTHMRHDRRSHNPCRTHPEMDISRLLRITLLSKILPNSK